MKRTVNSLRHKIIEIAKQNLNLKPTFSDNERKTKPFCAWFDQECKNLKTRLNKMRKSYENIIRISLCKTSPRVQEARNAYFEERRKYKKLLKYKRRSFLNIEKEKLWALKADSPKDFWSKLSKGKKQNNLDFSNSELYDYFNGLLNTNNASTNASAVGTSDTLINQDQPEISLDELALSAIDNSLNCPINFEEVVNMLKKTKIWQSGRP